jgi:hypothetical protein
MRLELHADDRFPDLKYVATSKSFWFKGAVFSGGKYELIRDDRGAVTDIRMVSKLEGDEVG